jgi:hypothetical protein
MTQDKRKLALSLLALFILNIVLIWLLTDAPG